MHKALAFLALFQLHRCASDRQPHAKEGTNTWLFRAVLAMEDGKNRATFLQHGYAELPTTSVQRQKSAYEGGICVCPAVSTLDLTKAYSEDKDT